MGIGYSSLAVSQGCVYTMGWADDQDTVCCFHADTGKELWKFSYPCLQPGSHGQDGPRATPAVLDGRVFTYSMFAELFCLDAVTGKVLWSKDMVKDYQAKQVSYDYASSPVVIDGRLIIRAWVPGNSVFAFDPASGKELWRSYDPEYARGGYWSTPAPFRLGDQKGLVILGGKAVAILDGASGKVLNEFKYPPSAFRSRVAGGLGQAMTPVVYGDKVFLDTNAEHGRQGYPMLVQFSAEKASVQWQNHATLSLWHTPVIQEGYLYGVDECQDDKGNLRCLDLSNGTVKWSERITTAFGPGPARWGPLMVADGKLIILLGNGELVIAEASPGGYRELARAKVLHGRRGGVVPVLANGRIYCRNYDGNLVCLDVSPRKS